MNRLVSELQWLLALPHYKFWSVMVFCEEISDQVLASYLLRAPRPHEPQSNRFLNHGHIGPILEQIHDLVFRVFVRLSTMKETRVLLNYKFLRASSILFYSNPLCTFHYFQEDYISPFKWGSLIYDNCFLEIPRLLQLSLLYGDTYKETLTKVVGTVLQNETRLLDDLKSTLPAIHDKFRKQSSDLVCLAKRANCTNKWEISVFQNLLLFNVEQVIVLFRFAEVYPNFIKLAHNKRDFEQTYELTSSYFV